MIAFPDQYAARMVSTQHLKADKGINSGQKENKDGYLQVPEQGCKVELAGVRAKR